MDTDVSIVSQNTDVTFSYADMVQSGDALKSGLSENVFALYRKELSDNTKLRQHNDLEAFTLYLSQIQVQRNVTDLEANTEAWRGISAAHVQGFQLWLEAQGYTMGTINVRLSTIRKYCELLKKAEVITQQELNDIQAVKGKNGRVARNADKDRERLGIKIRRGHKKADATNVDTSQVFQIKKVSTSGNGRQRGGDLLLQERDALLTGLIFEHALRCGEVVALDLENFNLQAGTMTFYREKTDRVETHTLKQHTRIAAERYITQLKRGIEGKVNARISGPLFTGYQGKRISKRAINARIAVLGEQVQAEGRLSPHDGRHYWAFDAFRNGTSLDRVVSGGGWRSPQMALHYAKRADIANDGVKISEEISEIMEQG